MSDNEQGLMAGHPPAMKVGGKRVPLPRHLHEAEPVAVVAADGVEVEKPREKVVAVSGVQVKEKDLYTTEATKAIFEKPQPTHATTMSAHNHSQNFVPLQQPRKN